MVLDAAGRSHFAYYGTPGWVNTDDAVYYVKVLSAPVPSPAFSTPQVVRAPPGILARDVEGP